MAERIIANLTLDTYQRNKIPPLVIPQHDYGARYIRVRITEQGENVSVASGSVVSIIAKRMADGQSAAFSGSVNADGSVLVPVTQWMLDAPSDDVDCHVAVTGTGYQYSTTSFVISPQERENPSYLEEDDPRVNIVEEALIKVVEEADRAEEQADLAQSAASTAASDAKEAARQEVEQLVGQLGIVQTLGNSRMAVVSQAVTTGLYNRNAKRIANLEQGFNEQFETDDSVAYVKDVPEGALPYAEVKKVCGMTYKDGDTLRSAKVTEVESVGVNMCDLDTAIFKECKRNGDIITSNVNNYYYATVTLETISDLVLSMRGKSITFSVKDNKDKMVSIVVFGTKADGSTYQEASSESRSVTMTIAEDFLTVSALELRFNRSDSVHTDTASVFEELMLNKGSTALPYTPYIRNTLPIPEAVQALDGYGWGINDKVYNYIDWEKKQFVKRCASVDLGTLEWTLGSVFYVSISGKKGDYNLLSAPYPAYVGGVSDMPDKSMTINTEYGDLLYIKDTSYTDATTFKAAMSGVMLVYELATPEIIDISSLITEDNFIGVEGNGTLTFKNAYEYAVPSEVEYQVEV